MRLITFKLDAHPLRIPPPLMNILPKSRVASIYSPPSSLIKSSSSNQIVSDSSLFMNACSMTQLDYTRDYLTCMNRHMFMKCCIPYVSSMKNILIVYSSLLIATILMGHPGPISLRRYACLSRYSMHLKLFTYH